MKVRVYNENYKGLGDKSSLIEVEEIYSVTQKPWYLVYETDNEFDNAKHYQIVKAQFVLHCKTELGVATIVQYMYKDEVNYHLLESVGGFYGGDHITVVDYESHKEICELTGEAPGDFMDHFKMTFKEDDFLFNTILDYEGMYYNAHDQEMVYKKIKGDQE